MEPVRVGLVGAGPWAELFTAPFGTSKNPVFALMLGAANFFMNLIEFVAKTVSLAMRLFGNISIGLRLAGAFTCVVLCLAIAIGIGLWGQNKAEAAQKSGRFNDEIVPYEVPTRKGPVVFGVD